MKYVALKLRSKTLDEKMSLATNLANNLTEQSVEYPDADPSPQLLTGKVDEIKDAKIDLAIAQTQLTLKLNALANLEDDLDQLLTRGGGYIQTKTKGNEIKIVSLGVAVRNTPAPLTSMERVQNLRLIAGKNAGEVKAIHKPVTGARSYEYQMTTDPTKEGIWILWDTASITRAMLKGLKSETRIYIRVRAVGGKRAGKGPWSDIAMVLVP